MGSANSKRGRGRPKTFDRARVIDVALENYWREGVEDLSLNEICRRAGVSKPGVYREFGGEDGLMRAALDRYMEVLAPASALLTQERPFTEVLTSLVEFMTQADRARPVGCLLTKMRGSPSRLGPVTSARVDELRAMILANYADWIDRAKARGEVAHVIPTKVAAAFVDAQVMSLLVQMAAGEDPAMLRAQSRLTFAGLTGVPFGEP